MKTKLKKFTALLMALMLILACFGCSSDSDKGDEKEKEGVEDSESKDDEATGADSEEDGGQSQSTFKNAKVGDYITFGSYEQDNNTSNGKEDIEWLVLDVQDGKALVISKYALDCKTYNTDRVDVTWETCTLRGWLNDEFINDAFSGDEKAMIPTVTVSADKNPEWDTDPGNATQDKVFLLSIAEVNKYCSSSDKRICEPTDYAVANGAYEYNSARCWWWLRSPGGRQDSAANVYSSGDVRGSGNYVDRSSIAVRPALWINL